jgi:hypothetical protein
MMPFGHTVQFESAAYGVTAQPVLRLDRAGTPTTSTRIVKWAGASGVAGGDFVTIANGSPNGTITGVAPAYSLKDYFLWFPSDVSPYIYAYQSKSHTAGAAAFELYKPYGLGESTANVPSKVATAVVWSPINVILNSPLWPSCVAVHYDRLFAGRAVTRTAVGSIPRGDYPNAIKWSDVGEPEKWNDTNMILVDDRPDDGIMGFGHIGKDLAILKRDRVYVMTGYSEATFSVTLLTAELGCTDSRSIVQYQDGVAFMSRKGYVYIDGSGGIQYLSQLEPGHGIHTTLLPEIARPDNTFTESQHLASSAALVQDHIILTNQYNITDFDNPINDSWSLYLKTNAWANWGNRESGVVPYCYTPGNQYIKGRVIAAFKNFLGEMDRMFYPISTASATFESLDETYNASDALVQFYIPTVVRTKDFRFWEGDTGRLRAIYVEHCIQYNGASDATQNGPALYIDTDRAISASPGTVGEVEPQYESGGLDTDRYYVREFRGGYYQREGAVFRFRMALENVVSGTYPHVFKWYTTRALTERTKPGRVQNTVPS